MKMAFSLILCSLTSALFGYEVTVDTVVANPGQHVAVPVSFDNVKGAANVGVRITYDPQVLVLLKASEGTLTNTLADDYVVVADESAGVVSVSAFGKGNVETDVGGTLASLVFMVREGTQGQYSDLAIAKVSVGEESGVKDVTVGNAIRTRNGMVRVMARDAAVKRLENAQVLCADVELGAVEMSEGDAIQASDSQTPIAVAGAVTGVEKIPVKAPANGWASGKYELLRTTTRELSFEIVGEEAVYSAITNGAYVTYIAEIKGDGELPVAMDGEAGELSAGTMNQIRNSIAKLSNAEALSKATSIAIGGGDAELVSIVADMGIAPRLVEVDKSGVAHFTYSKPTISIMSFNPETGHVRVKVVPGSGNEIVSEIATGYVHVYGTDSLGEKMKYISKVGFDLTPYLKADTKGEADLMVELGSHTFLKIKVESVKVSEGDAEK